MELFTRETGGLSRGNVKLPTGSNPLQNNVGGLGGNTFKQLKPWIRGEIYDYEDGEKEWENEHIDRLNDEALGYDSDFSENAGMLDDDDEQLSPKTKATMLEKTHENINKQEGYETDFGDDSIDYGKSSGLTETLFEHLNVSEATRASIMGQLPLQKNANTPLYTPLKTPVKTPVQDRRKDQKLALQSFSAKRRVANSTFLPQQITRDTLKHPIPIIDFSMFAMTPVPMLAITPPTRK